jgi:predicted O-methyltransferase YrrM
MLQQEQEFTHLLQLYQERQPHHTLEIGVLLGGTLYHWLRHAPPDATIVALDENHVAIDEYEDWPTQAALHTITGDSHHHTTIQAVAQWAPYDWIFIDADHHEQDVRADWVNYGLALSAPGATIALHDIRPLGDPTIQVDRLWDELRLTYDDTLEIDHGGHGIGVITMPTLVSTNASE